MEIRLHIPTLNPTTESITNERELFYPRLQYDSHNMWSNIILFELSILGNQRNILAKITFEMIRKYRLIDVLVMVRLAHEVDYCLDDKFEQDQRASSKQHAIPNVILLAIPVEKVLFP